MRTLGLRGSELPSFCVLSLTQFYNPSVKNQRFLPAVHCGMTATGSHGNYDSLRGAPPFTQGSWGAPAPVRLSMVLGKTGKLYHIPYPPQKRRDTLAGARPHQLAPCGAGLSHGLKTCHRHVFLTAFRVPCPFHKKNTIRKDGVLFMGWIMGLEPTIFRATI